jgi:Methyltransferase domain
VINRSREHISTPKSESVQYGCGWQAPTNWLNFDSSPTLCLERLPFIGRLYTKNERRSPENVWYGDIAKGLPVGKGSVARLFASHVIEHLCYQDALIAIKRSYELLKPGGLFRLIVPDLKARAQKYIGWRSAMIEIFGGSHHLWMWDEASLFTICNRKDL